MSNTPSSGSATPSQRFTSQVPTAEDLLKEHTVGLVHLSDFRKRRAEALDQVSRDGTPAASGASTPDKGENGMKSLFKKKVKGVKKGPKIGGLSFADNEEEGDTTEEQTLSKPREDTPEQLEATITQTTKRLKPNLALEFAPKAQTKSALRKEAALKDALRKEYSQLQEAVRETEFCLPFVFFDGKDAPGGMCRMKKGDLVWLFLERARKVGAAAAMKGGAAGGGMLKDWARIGVDDLMLVKGDIILGHHFDFHHFILNRTTGYNKNGAPLFSYSSEPTSATPSHLLSSKTESSEQPAEDARNPPAQSYLTLSSDRQKQTSQRVPDSELEGFSDSPSLTKVVDRRWYERNKHIYPASLWEEYDPRKDYTDANVQTRKDGLGNAYFFGR